MSQSYLEPVTVKIDNKKNITIEHGTETNEQDRDKAA